jgi:Spy/CpxP family protein refolding chaperone
MRSRFLAAAALLAAILIAAPAFAQRQGGRGFGGGIGFGGGFGFGGGGVSGLLQMEEVRKEVELLDDQWTQIQKINEEARAAREQQGGGFDRESFQNLSEEERNKRIAEFREQGEKRAKETDAKVKEVLLPHQTERLEQLALQRQGVRALATEEVQGKLAFTDDQKKKITAIQEEQMERFRSAFQRGQNQQGERPNFEEMRAQAQKDEAAMVAVLTDGQKKQFEEMKGKPFEFPQRQFGQGGGQGRRPGGDGQGRPRGEGEGGARRPGADNQ